MPPIVLILDPFAAIATPAGCAFMASPGVAMRSNGDRTPCQAEQPAGFWGAEGMQPRNHSLQPVGKTHEQRETAAAALGRSTARTTCTCMQGR